VDLLEDGFRCDSSCGCGSDASLEDGRCLPDAASRRRSLCVDGRGQKAIRHLGRRLEARAHGFRQIFLEVWDEEAADGFRNKGRHGSSGSVED